MTWAWFRPSADAWKQGARTWRCDVVGGGERAAAFTALPRTARGLLLGKPDDRWLVCVDGPTVSGSAEDPVQPARTPGARSAPSCCGKKADAYPGDRLSEVRTRDFCRASVGAFLQLSGRLRLRLHLVPRRRVEGRQPPVRLLGEDDPVNRRPCGRRGTNRPRRSSLLAGCTGGCRAVLVGLPVGRRYVRVPDVTRRASASPSGPRADGDPGPGRPGADGPATCSPPAELTQPHQRRPRGGLPAPAQRAHDLRGQAGHGRRRALGGRRLGDRCSDSSPPPARASWRGTSAARRSSATCPGSTWSGTARPLQQADQGADWFRCDLIAFAGQRHPGCRSRRPAAADLQGVLAGRARWTPTACAGPRPPARRASSG